MKSNIDNLMHEYLKPDCDLDWVADVELEEEGELEEIYYDEDEEGD